MSSRDRPVTADPTLPFQTLGRYRVQRTLGSGGMGTVYRAWDPQLERAIAIKVVKPEFTDEAMRLRLVKEAQALAKLSHANVCHVYDVGTEGETLWVAMELVDGTSLRPWSDSHPVPELLRVLRDAAEGLAAAHAANIVHRDVKPENVLVGTDCRAVVTDFGLARADNVDAVGSTISGDLAMQKTASTGSYATQSGIVAGTPAYLAPEQLTGAPLDARVDQFAWGVMAWELITGIRPFPIVASERLVAIRNGITPPPSMSPALASVLVRAMMTAPRDRFPTMRALIDAFSGAIASPVVVGPPSGSHVTGEQVTTPQPATKQRGVGGLVLAGFAVLAALFVAALVTPALAGEIKFAEGKATDVPKNLTARGKKIERVVTFKDKNGANYIVYSSTTTEKPIKDEEFTLRTTWLYIDHWSVADGKAPKSLLPARDTMECGMGDLLADFVTDSLTMTDIDGDGIAEVTYGYQLACRSDVSAATYKVLLVENGKKYILRGYSKLPQDNPPEGGTFKPEPDAKKWPKGFYDHAVEVWNATSQDLKI